LRPRTQLPAIIVTDSISFLIRLFRYIGAALGVHPAKALAGCAQYVGKGKAPPPAAPKHCEGTGFRRAGPFRFLLISVSRRPGLSRNWTPVSLSAITTGKSSPMYISRMSRGEDRWPSCSAKMRREGLRRTPPSCPSCDESHRHLKGASATKKVENRARVRSIHNRRGAPSMLSSALVPLALFALIGMVALYGVYRAGA